MSDDNDREESEYSIAQNLPQGFDPSILIAPGIAFIKHAWDIRKDIKDRVPSAFALRLSMLDSSIFKERHVIEVALGNTTDCGIYLNAISISPPTDKRLDRSILEAGERNAQLVRKFRVIGEHRDAEPAKFPVFLPPDTTLSFFIEFDLFTQRHHSAHPYALATFRYFKLNEMGPTDIIFVLGLRWHPTRP